MKNLKTALQWITGIDPDLWSQTPGWNQATIAAEYMLLFIVAAISGIAWAQFWGMSNSGWSSTIVGLTAFTFMFLLDRLIVSSDWRLAGIFRRPDAFFGWEFWTRISMRFLMTAVFSVATSTGAQMAMCSEAIRMEIEHSVRVENQRIGTYYTGEINKLIQRDIGQQAGQLKAVQKQVADLTPEVDRDRQAVVAATERFRVASEDMDRELTGKDGRRGGKGEKYRAAEAEADAAATDLAKGNSLLATFEPRLQDAQAKLFLATAGYDTAKAAIQPKIDALENERNTHLQSTHQDALLSFVALGRVLTDPQRGGAAIWFGRLMFAVLMTIEMSFLIVRTVFSQASIYTALLIKDARKRMGDLDDKPPSGSVVAFAPIRFIPARPRAEASGN